MGMYSLKYEKYLNRNGGALSRPKITIDSKTFYLVSIWKRRDGRKLATVICQGDTHMYYTSQSDGEFWRYCVHRTTDKGHTQYDKGINYTSTTMINMKLQLFLFEQEEKRDFVIEKEFDPKECIINTFVEETDETLHERL